MQGVTAVLFIFVVLVVVGMYMPDYNDLSCNIRANMVSKGVVRLFPILFRTTSHNCPFSSFSFSIFIGNRYGNMFFWPTHPSDRFL